MGEIERQRDRWKKQKDRGDRHRDRWEKYKEREIEGKSIETQNQRDRADYKNPKQSWVAQLVFNNIDSVTAHKVVLKVEACEMLLFGAKKLVLDTERNRKKCINF